MSFAAGSRRAPLAGPYGLLLALGLVFSMFVLVASPAFANGATTCKDFAGGIHDGNYTSGQSGDWGSITFTQDSGSLQLTVETGWEVDLCLFKANTAIHAPDNPYGEGDHTVDYPGFDPADGFSHYGIKLVELDPTAPTVTVTTCESSESVGSGQVRVQISNPDNATFSYDIVNDGATVDTVTGDWDKTYDGTVGTTLEVKDGNTARASADFEDCSMSEDPSPTVELSAACDGTQPTATVTIDNDGDEAFEVEVVITNVSQGTITETTTFDGDALGVLRAEWGEEDSDEVTFEDCTVDEPLTSTASFTVGSECQSGLPALTYDATISETADDPVGDVVLTVSDTSGELGQVTFSESDAGSMVLPAVLEGVTVNASWDFDDTTLEQTLASGCADVLGAVDEREDEPAALPATEVKGEQIGNEQLPNAGSEHVVLLVLGSALIALGGFCLRVADRRRTVFG